MDRGNGNLSEESKGLADCDLLREATRPGPNSPPEDWRTDEEGAAGDIGSEEQGLVGGATSNASSSLKVGFSRWPRDTKLAGQVEGRRFAEQSIENNGGRP